ncbi:MAG: heavy metal translocating P-type ATPase [Cytophagaceae bacterium]
MSNIYQIPLTGVHSEHCALIVDKSLSANSDIKSHRVDFNNEVAVVEFNSNTPDLKSVANTIKDIGYGVVTKKQTFPVTGLSCASCAVSVESMSKTQVGVIDASVNYGNSEALIEYIPGVLDLNGLKSAIQSVGYDILIEQTEDVHEIKEELHQQMYQELKTKTLWAGILCIPIVILGMFWMDFPHANWIMLAFTIPVIFYFGRSFFINAWKQAKHGSANMDTLVALSTGIAFLFSLFTTIYPEFWMARGQHPHVYYEAASVIIVFILLGKLLEEKAKSNTSSAIKKLIGLQPKTVIVVHEGGHEMEMPISSVQVGNILLVKPGNRIPVDGEVVSGSSFVDESMINGEPIPIEKLSGAKVFAGTINQKGSFKFKAEKVGGDTILAQIIQMVQEAQGSKAPVQKMVDKIAGVFVPVVMFIALLSLVGWILLGGENALVQGILSMVTVLVIACPCALGLATPTAIMVGIGKGAEHGILIKDAESLQLAHTINAIILDKTGTITEGKPEVVDVMYATNEEEIQSVVLAMESHSEHPLADALVQHLKSKNIQPAPIEKIESITGKGLEATYQGSRLVVGNLTLMSDIQSNWSDDLKTKVDSWKDKAYTIIAVSKDKEVKAIYAVADKIKQHSAHAIKELQALGIEVYMLTGDSLSTAKAVSSQVGIQHYKAEMLPSDKANFIKELQQNGKIVAMVGDGINDSHALAQANVSIAMGKGSDIAIDVAKMTIISSDLMKIPTAIKLSKKTVRTIHENLFWAFIYNLIGIPIAAGLLYPIWGFMLSPMIAGAAMALSSVSVVSNSLLLKVSKIK